MLDFCLLHYFVANVMVLLKCHHSLHHCQFFLKKELVLYSIMLRVIPLGLTLLYKYCPLTLENILSLVLLMLLLFLLFLIFFFSFVFRNHFMKFIYFIFVIQKNFFLIILEFIKSEIEFYLLYFTITKNFIVKKVV